jgi:hypothetical protein
MNRTSAITTSVLAAITAMGCAADTSASDQALVIEASAPDQLLASLSVDGEAISIAIVDRDGTRDTAVTGEDGTSYAVWHTRLSDHDTWGSYGERSFGRLEDADSDGDTAAWAAVATSRVGEVLRAVSLAATDAAGDERLATVGQIYPSLALLARDPGEAAYNDCWFGYGNYDLWAYCSDTGIIVGAQTYRPSSSCTRDYYVQIYRESPWTYICGDGTGDGEFMRAVCARTPGFGGFRAYTSKHWDSLNAGSPIWLRRGVTCY